VVLPRKNKYYNDPSCEGCSLKTLDVSPSQLGLREQNKLEKRQRIRAAARELFSKHGYDAATLRQIAHRAHVGLGTLFNYAQDKRDLVFLIFNEELSAVTNEALSAPRPHQPLLDQLSVVSKRHYDYFSRDPALSRILLKELVFYSEGKQAATFQEIRGRLLSGIEKLVREAQEDGRILCTENPAIITRQFFFVFSAAIRWWIANRRPDPVAGLADLKRLLKLQIEGLRPVAGAARKLPRAAALIRQSLGRTAHKNGSATKRGSPSKKMSR
jgi:AcrR family transcriptional regulator